MTVHTLEDIEVSGRAMLATLDAATYGGGTWTPTLRPGDLLGDAKSLGRLLFDLVVVDGDPERRWTSPPGAGCGSIEQQRGRLMLSFSLPIDGTAEGNRTAMLHAGRAGEAAARALCSPPWRARRPYVVRRRYSAEGTEVGTSQAAENARWLVTTVELEVPIDFRLDPAVAQPPGSAPVVEAYIVGTAAAGATLTARPVLLSGSTPVTWVYAWLIGGAPGGTAESIVLPGDWVSAPITVTATATGPGGLTGSGTSQAIGGDGGGPVDCEVECEETIAAAVLAATTPLQAQITELTTALATRTAERDQALADVLELEGDLATLQGEYDALADAYADLLEYIDELEVQLQELQDELTVVSVALAAAAGWVNYGLVARASQTASFSFHPTTGQFTIVHPGDSGTDPGDAAASVATWELKHTDGTPAPRRPTFEMALFATPNVAPSTTEITATLTDGPALESPGSYGLSGGMVMVNAASNSAVVYGRTAGGGWGRTVTSNRTSASVVLSGQRSASGGVSMRSFLAGASNTPIATGGSAANPSFAWGLGSGGPDVSHLHLEVRGPACTITGYLLVAPTILGAPTP